VHHNPKYDNKDQVKSFCQRRVNPVGILTQDDYYEYIFPFPYLGAYSSVKETDARTCLGCFQLQHNGKRVYFQAMDTTNGDVELGKLLFDKLSGGNAAGLKSINATIVQVDGKHCRLSEQQKNN
jgi:hypothetical protein